MTHVPTAEASPETTILPRPGVYRHFKGAEYELLYVARHSETEELLAVYCSLDDPETLWVRPVEMFTEMVIGPSGNMPRFELRLAKHTSRTPWPRLDAGVKHLARRLWRYGPLGFLLSQSGSSGRATRQRRGRGIAHRRTARL